MNIGEVHDARTVVELSRFRRDVVRVDLKCEALFDINRENPWDSRGFRTIGSFSVRIQYQFKGDLSQQPVSNCEMILDVDGRRLRSRRRVRPVQNVESARDLLHGHHQRPIGRKQLFPEAYLK